MTDKKKRVAKKKKILIVDDERIVRLGLRSELKNKFDIFLAGDADEAVALMEEYIFSAAMIDVNLKKDENGFDLAIAARAADPNMAIIMMTCNIDNFLELFPDQLLDDVDCIVKDFSGKFSERCLIGTIQSAIGRKRMSREIRLRRLKLLHNIYRYKGSVSKVFRQLIWEKSGQVDKYSGILRRSGSKFAWNEYKLFQHRNMVTVSIVSSIGCIGRCLFCNHGNHDIELLLEPEEMVAQGLHALDSLLARGVYRSKNKLRICIHFTAMGEPLSNLRNVLKAIQIFEKIDGLDISYIITTTGRESDLKALNESLESLGIDLSKLRLYLSVNFSDSRVREMMMPVVKGQNLDGVRTQLRRFRDIAGNNPTASFIFIPGMNDSDEDVARMASEWGEFDIKLQAFAPSPEFEHFPVATMAQLRAFRRRLIKSGAKNVRIRIVVGGSKNAGCGSTRMVKKQVGK